MFRFTHSYQPGSRNIKPDALYRLSLPELKTDQGLTTILSPDCFAAAAQCEIEKQVMEAQRANPDPGTGQTG